MSLLYYLEPMIHPQDDSLASHTELALLPGAAGGKTAFYGRKRARGAAPDQPVQALTCRLRRAAPVRVRRARSAAYLRTIPLGYYTALSRLLLAPQAVGFPALAYACLGSYLTPRILLRNLADAAYATLVAAARVYADKAHDENAPQDHSFCRSRGASNHVI